MTAPPTAPPATTVAARFAAFVAERHPFALDVAAEALEAALEGRRAPEGDAAAIESLRPRLGEELAARVDSGAFPELPETTPGVGVAERLAAAGTELAAACDGFLAREAIAASLTPEERRDLLRGMLLTRAVDNRLKAFFTGGEVRWEGKPFQGKGFRSLGQEAIYAAPLRLRRGPDWRREGEEGAAAWAGDVVAPLIRDLGAALAMGPEREAVRQVLSAQMGKAGPPMDGRDLHIGDWSWGVLPPAAPLSISSLNVAGLAMAFARQAARGNWRVAVSFIGEGGTSLGEWHEAINLCAARRLPAVFCVENNQTALSTPVPEQSAVRVFADKAVGYGVPGVTLDGNDPEAIAAAFAWAVERARSGQGPALIELITMRMCGHAHHDDMLYVGRDPQPSWEYPELVDGGYADRAAWEFWRPRDPIAVYHRRLLDAGVVAPGELERWREELTAIVEEAASEVVAAPWPDPATVARRVVAEAGPAAGGPERAEAADAGGEGRDTARPRAAEAGAVRSADAAHGRADEPEPAAAEDGAERGGDVAGPSPAAAPAAEGRSARNAPTAGETTTAGGGPAATAPSLHREPLADRPPPRLDRRPALPPLDPGLPFARDGRTFLEAVMLGVGDALAADPRVFVYGEDVGGRYGNAFLLLRPLLGDHGDRIVNSTLAEGGVLGVCVGAALAGLRPIGEIQFNDFVATGFNQLVNNAAKIRYRWGAAVPMVVRMPWGGLRHAGPYHSQNTEAWFYRTPGLKIVVPSTPEDARALLAAAVADPDPVLYYEHIALYRDPRIKQRLAEEAPDPLPLGRAALRRTGSHLAIVSYGAYVHVAQRVAERLAADGIEAAVLDLRTLAPLDRASLLAVARHTGKLLVVHEDTRTGSVGESLAAIVQEEAFEYLDAPVRVVGALDTPVPYSPPLEAAFLPSEAEVERAARLLAAY